MNNLDINISSNSIINAIYFGLIISGYEYSDINKSETTIALCNQVRNYSRLDGLDDLKRYFGCARQNTCEPYPFWPRAALLESLAFFIDDGISFDKYCEYVKTLPNLTEEERDGDFFSWVKEFPKYLSVIKTSDFFQETDKRIECIVNNTSTAKESELARIIGTLNSMTQNNKVDVSRLSVIICPLKCVYSADYFLQKSEMSVILGDFLPHSVVHEYMHLIVHPEIMKHKNAILSISGDKLFDIDRSYYLNNDEGGLLNAFEEHIVRTASLLVCDKHDINIEQLITQTLHTNKH
ncbi:MAG: hypothetical protein FWG63_06940 [Defluviitaleaceae bacterium]|nr:hypothetical protein [Defluviitaleaceae bacterium]